MTHRFVPAQPHLSPDQAEYERARNFGSMNGVTLLRRTCSLCRCSKSMVGGTTHPRFVCADCRAPNRAAA